MRPAITPRILLLLNEGCIVVWPGFSWRYPLVKMWLTHPVPRPLKVVPEE